MANAKDMNLKRLIINADDFGYDADTFAVTADLMRKGVVRSATLLVGYPETEAAIRFAKTYAKDCSFGLHFNIAEQCPLSREPVPSLVDGTGAFRGAISQRLRALAGMLDADDIAREAGAQLSILADNGIIPSHIDSHGHFHKFPAVLSALRPVLKRFGVARARRPQTMYDNQRIYNGLLDRYCNGHFNGIASTHHFFNTRSHDSDWFNRFLTMLPEGTTELGVHPGHTEDWRIAEARPLSAEDFLNQVTQSGTELISFHDIAP
jgi:chitin disaccharide deacetylase